jgi:hypothetical protein
VMLIKVTSWSVKKVTGSMISILVEFDSGRAC